MKLLFIPVAFVLMIFPSCAFAEAGVTNNKFGIHIISPVEGEIKNAAALVNSSGGDWGYVTVVIQRNDRDLGKWQNFFNLLRRYHLIPIVRIATEPVADYWKKPDGEDAKDWAEFLDGLVWPVKFRYVVIYNEPNHSREWENTADPANYARVLASQIDELNNKSEDFFVLNGGFDQAAPHAPSTYYSEEKFLEEMNKAVPGVFNKLDGWVSHSYPNPGFSGSPNDVGRGTIRGYEWELSVLKKLGVEHDLPVFITETGWQHAEGARRNPYLPTAQTIADYFHTAFSSVWNDSRIMAVTPFILDYPQPPFDHFSFKTLDSQFYPHYDMLASLAKKSGEPSQVAGFEFETKNIDLTLVRGKQYYLPVRVKNTGQSIWGEYGRLGFRPTVPTETVGEINLPDNVHIEPGQSFTFYIPIATQPAIDENIKIEEPIDLNLNLFIDEEQVADESLTIKLSVKDPDVISLVRDKVKDFLQTIPLTGF